MAVRIKGKQVQVATRSRQAKVKKAVRVVADRRVIVQTDAGVSENFVQEAAVDGADAEYWNTKKRVLGRKFIALWIEKVFGRVSPSKARELLMKKMKKRYFEQWYHVYWQSRIEWKLNIRADCHNKYQLFSKYWIAWKQFVKLRKDVRARMAMVQKAVLVKLKERSFNAWTIFVQLARARRDVKQKAIEVGNRSRLRFAWHTWMAELKLKADRCTLLMHVDQKRNKQLMIRMWWKWRKARDWNSLERERHKLAVQLYHLKLVTLCMNRWKMYIKANKEQTRMHAVAVSHYQNEVLVKTYAVWYQRLQRTTELKQLQQLIETMKVKARLKRYLRLWQAYVQCKQKEQQQRVQAIEWYHRSLQHHCLTWIMKYAAQRHKEKQEDCAAFHFRNDQMLRRWWRKWMVCLETAEERRMLPKTEMALAKSRTSILKTTFHAWLQYHSMKRTELATRVLVDNKVKRKLFHRYFSAWKEYHNQVYEEKTLKLKGMQYRRESLLAIVFYIWMDCTVHRQEGALLKERAIVYHDGQLKKAIFKVWRTRTVEEKRLTAMQAQAVHYCNRMVILRVFRVWQSQQTTRLMENQNREVSEVYHRRRSMGVVWQAWMNYIVMKRYKKHKQLLADNCYARSLCQKVLNGWKVWHNCHQTKQSEYGAASALYQMKLQRRCMLVWQGNVSLLKNAKCMATAAVQHYQTTVLQECFDKWKQMTFGTCTATNEQAHLLCVAASAFNAKGKLRAALSIWKHATIARIHERTCSSSAEMCYSNNVMRKCLHAWKHYHHCQLRKKLLAQQSVWFREVRILSSYYAKWRVMFSQTLLEKSKTSIALWHWSRGLKHKCLCTWRIYTCDKKRKKARYSTAMASYHRNLLKIGVASWITHVSRTTTVVENNLIQQKEEPKRSLALRCIRHWRQVALGKLHAKMDEHIPLLSAGETVNVSGDGTLFQARAPTFLNQRRSDQMHSIADSQEQPSTDVLLVREEASKESASVYSTDAVSVIMKTRDMLLELYKARTEQRTLYEKLQSLDPLSTDYAQVQRELHNVSSFLSIHEELVVKEISVVNHFTNV